MKGAPLENLKEIPIVRSASMIFIVLGISLLIYATLVASLYQWIGHSFFQVLLGE